MTEINILLCTYNGSRFLDEQLTSFNAQTFGEWRLWVSDDGSKDDTPAIVQGFRDPSGRPAQLVNGPGRGFAANFLSLLCTPDLAPGYVALSDQDDVWFPEKLERAFDLLSQADPEIPTLVCGRTLLTDGALTPLGPSRRYKSFALGNALVQNVVAGNTIVLNPAAHRLVRTAGVAPVPYHDWWCYLLITAAGGQILYDPEPCMYYRQHPQNVLGENLSLGAVARRAGSFSNRTWRGWFETNLAALTERRALLTPEAQSRLAAFNAHDRSTALGRTRALIALAPYRQKPVETAALYLGTLLGLS